MKVLAAICFLAASLAVHAQVYRCTDRGGAVTYQETSCPPATDGGATDIPTAFPEVNRAERERLLAREAALDARILKRAEIDAAERIARDDRDARERELAALRDELARRDAEQPGAGFVLVQPLRAPRPRHRLDRRIPNWRPS